MRALNIDDDGREIRILRVQFDAPRRNFQPLQRDLIIQARYDNLPALRLWCAMHRHLIAIDDAGIAHAHAVHTQEIIRSRMKQARLNRIMPDDIFHRQHRLPRRHPPY